MNTVAEAVRTQVDNSPAGSFFSRADFLGTETAIDTALGRLARHQQLIRVRKGLYWKGKPTRFGMAPPQALEVALAIAGPGAGPTGIAAAHVLGLTTQVPATLEVAAPGNVPDPYPGVRFRSRAYERRLRELQPLEVAVLELLRDPLVAEVDMPTIAKRISHLAMERSIRADILIDEAADEANVGVRTLLAQIFTAA